LVLAPIHAEAARQPNAGELIRAIEGLSVVGKVLYVAAHPDDENTRLLAWLRHEKHLRAGYLSLTRGEGGQNLIGPEQQPLLGVIRTQELLAARGVDGAEQFFTRARDFGYSKSPEETLGLWDRDAILTDVVRVIRRFRPDVIVTRFPPDERGNHGHHTASAKLAIEAFHAAADPTFHPEALGSIEPWQARRIVWDAYFNGSAPTPEEAKGKIALKVSGYDPLLGLSYGEIAAASRSMHKSQGFGASANRAPLRYYFQHLDGEPATESILDGIDTSWRRTKGSDRLREILARARKGLDITDPVSSIPVLLEASRTLEGMPDSPYKADKRIEIAEIIAACAGLFAEATSRDFSQIPGAPVPVTTTLINRTPASLALASMRYLRAGEAGDRIAIDKPLAKGLPITVERAVPAPERMSTPYWLVDPPEAGRFLVADPSLVGRAEESPTLAVELEIQSGGSSFTITRPVTYKWNDPVAGERHRPLEILPPVTAKPSAPVLMFPDGSAKELRLTVRASTSAASGEVAVVAPAGWTVDAPSRRFAFAKKGDEIDLAFRVHPPARIGAGESTSAEIAFEVTYGHGGARSPLFALARVDYPHIPIQVVLSRATVKLVRLDHRRAKTRIGYVVGAGDEVPAALRQVGYDVDVLSDDALAHDPLKPYQAIVVGVRAFNTNPRLPNHHHRLMEYVAGGGTLLVQYNTKNWVSDVPADIGPYPFSISQDRVTDENADVEPLSTDHPILHRPNAISARDFAGWVQERGLYFADKWDEHYQVPLAMHDPGEPQKKGALLIARYGKGAFIYTGLAFFRQLPAGVAGAYRLLSNLIAY
jgi:LmbE family N-acetylglucosaminyl deacetylase